MPDAPSGGRRGWLSGLLAMCVSVAVFVTVLVAAYAAAWPLAFDKDRILGQVTTGFYPREANSDRSWVWTGPHAEVTLAGLDRRVPWRWTAVASVWRPPGVAMPHVIVSVDGVVVHEHTLTRDDERLEVTIPSRADGAGLGLTLDVVPSFVPSPGDTRQLGISITSMSLEPVGRPGPPRPALFAGVLAAVAMSLGLWLVGVRGVPLLALAMLGSIGQAWALTRGFAVYGDYAWLVPWLAAGLCAGAVALVWLVDRGRGAPIGAIARAAVGVSLVACFLKLLVLLHPSMPVGDVLFHAHRFEYVLGGQFYFTSVAPGAFAFPYPILLYLVSAPFSVFTPDTLGRMELLRIVVTVTDATAAMMLYWMVVRTLTDARVAFASVVWYHLMPVTGWIMTWGNLTNAFAQPLGVAALAMLVALPVDWHRRRSVVALSVVAGAALLAHPSTSAILVTVMAATAVLYRWRGGPELRGAARGVWVAAIAAGVGSFVLYYAWFASTYVTELPRVISEAAVRTDAAGVAILPRLALFPRDIVRFFGLPAVFAAAVGLWRLVGRSAPRRLTLMLAAWLGACLFFLGVGVVTPVALRSHFAAFPALALLAALGTGWAWSSRWPLKLGAVAIMLGAAWAGVDQWIRLLVVE